MNPACLKVKAYRVPQAGCPVKLNQNESPYDVPQEVKVRVLERIQRASWNRYPSLDDRLLRKRIGRYNGFPSRGVVLGNSSNEIIQAVLIATCEPGRKMVVVEPGFSVYRRLGLIFDRDVCSVPLGRDFKHDPEAVIASGRDARLVMIASPNNPTGTGFTVPQIEKLLRSLRGYLAVDEAYFEFSGQTCLPLIGRYERLMVIRTFSKAFGLAGLRLGYLLARPRVCDAVAKIKLPFSVGITQPAAALEMLEDPQRIRRTVRQILRERERMRRSMNAVKGLKVIPSRTNFLLFRPRGRTAGAVFEGLRKRGVLVRSFEGTSLRDWLRVTVGRPHENDCFLRHLRSLMEEK